MHNNFQSYKLNPLLCDLTCKFSTSWWRIPRTWRKILYTLWNLHELKHTKYSYAWQADWTSLVSHSTCLSTKAVHRSRQTCCTDKNMHDSNLHLHRTERSRTGQIFEQLHVSVQVWDPIKADQLYDWHGSNVTWTRVNARTVQPFAHIVQVKAWSYVFAWLPSLKICMEPCKHHCNL